MNRVVTNDIHFNLQSKIIYFDMMWRKYDFFIQKIHLKIAPNKLNCHIIRSSMCWFCLVFPLYVAI